MFRPIHQLTTLILLSIFLLSFQIKEEGKLILRLNNVQNKGTMFISLCSAADQWTDNGKYRFTLPVTKGGTVDFTLTGIPKGKYSIAIFQDVNMNGKMDTNLFGVPTEPYGFSNNIKPVFSAPTYQECNVQYSTENQLFLVDLID